MKIGMIPLSPYYPSDDTKRLNWLNTRGRLVHTSDGWHAWRKGRIEDKCTSEDDVRVAIDLAMALGNEEET